MVRALLVRGMLAGAVAAVAAFVFAYLFGEPAVDAGIAFEENGAGHAAHAGAAAEVVEPELVSRGVQSTLGLGVALLVYGVAIGGILALVFAAAYGRLGRLGPRATAGVLAAAGYLVLVLVPMLKYPSNPPGSSEADTIGSRTGLYVLFLMLSVLAAIAAVMAGRRLVARLGSADAVLAAAAGYLVVMAVIGALLPAVAETPPEFPAAVLYDFRMDTLGMQLVLWGGLGLVFGWLVNGRSGRAEHTGFAVGAATG